MIDLTEVHGTDDPSPEAVSNMQHACPICRQMFDDSAIQVHANQCLAAAQGEGVQSSEEGAVSSNDDIPRRRVRLVAAKKVKGVRSGRQESSRKSHQQTLNAFESTMPSRTTQNGVLAILPLGTN